MKILSLWQPWATFMELGFKLNETRSWATSYRGPLAIHAAKNTSALDDADDILEAAGFDMSERTTVDGTNWPLGEIVAVVRLVDCMPTETIRDSLSRRERAMGNYSDGRFAWVTSERRQIRPGVRFRGMQGLKDLPEGILTVPA
jgi:hypothetical protein